MAMEKDEMSPETSVESKREEKLSLTGADYLNEKDRCNSSDTEVGFLMIITCHDTGRTRLFIRRLLIYVLWDKEKWIFLIEDCFIYIPGKCCPSSARPSPRVRPPTENHNTIGERFMINEESAASVGTRPWTPEGRSLTLSIAFML
ncbi:hypothetical protein AVEN_179163-1 [Araneus ventricosus]|uniref:Uncharacterized protein n=1 Tax=Araneus ventricosus TaxID=182803 RepID=A0A4Y2HN20_ARAVE|nr:hypothetical protein AVEN_179163-1 [Araneus ventricosus]